MKTNLFVKLAVLAGLAAVTAVPEAGDDVMKTGKLSSTTVPPGVRALVTRRSLSFEPNIGQTDQQVRFLARAKSYAVYLTEEEAVFVFRRAPDGKKGRRDHSLLEVANEFTPRPPILRMRICEAAMNTQVVASDPDSAHVNYYFGAGRDDWHEAVPTYNRVSYNNIYPSIDLVYHSDGDGNLRYDFEIAPGGNPRAIHLQFGDDANENTPLATDGEGNLVITARDGVKLRWKKPFAYQEIDGAVKEVAASYALLENNRVGFSIGSFDQREPLIIDPVLSYSTYIGGGSTDDVTGVAVDSAGNAWVTGYTGSTNFPVAGSPYQGTNRNNDNSPDVFVSKFSPSGALLYSTYFGGTGDDLGLGLALDNSGNPWITGRTRSTDLPVTGSPAQSANAGGGDAFVAKFSGVGNLLYSSYLGGSGDDEANAVAVDGSGNAWITGDTASTNFRTAGNPARPASGGGIDGFVSKFSSNGQLLYSTYLGGSDDDFGFGIGVDSSGSAWVTGTASSTNFPLSGTPVQMANAGLADAFVAKFSASGFVEYSTYLGGVNNDNGFAIAVDAQGNAWAVGDTGSPDFRTTSGAYRTSYPGFEDAFVSKFAASGGLLYSTYLGGSGLDVAFGIAIAPAGDVFVTGSTTSSNDFPLTPNPLQSALGGGIQDAFVTKFTGSGALSYSTFIGGAGVEESNAIAVSSANQVWLAGYTVSSDFPVGGTPLQATGGGDNVDGFVTKVNGVGAPATEHALLNISTRMRVETGDNALIGGFIVQGTKRKRVIVRAIGPSLSANGIPASETLQDPTLELHDGTGAIVVSNDNWGTGSQRQAIIDSTLSPTDDRESAVVAALDPGAYTAVVRGSGATSGVGLIEIYDIDAASSSKAVNISTRGRVQTGGNVMIGGFILGGTTPTTVIVRAIGPSLGSSVSGALQDPAVELRNGNGTLVDSNDNWVDSPQRQAIIDTGIPPSDNRESAVLDTLNPGSYTAVLQGVNATQGVALVEVYKLN